MSSISESHGQPTDQPIELKYHSRWQFDEFHDRTQRFAVLVCHRRAGKTVATINDLIIRALTQNKPDGRYGMVAPLYNQVKDNAWSYLKDYTRNIVAEEPREAELSVLLKSGQRIRLYGADNPDRLRGGYFDGVVLDEFADMKSTVWQGVVLPMLADRNGWATIIGTPKGKNEFWKLYEHEAKKHPELWFRMMLKASESGIISAQELAQIRTQQSENLYEQEFECSFEAAIQGAIYGPQMKTMMAEGRIVPIKIEKGIRTHTSWDLGISDSTAICFWQCVGRERRLVDYYEASGVPLKHYVDILHDKKREHGFEYGDHFLPHDVTVRSLNDGRSRKDTLAALGIECTIVPQHDEGDGIEVVRKMLGRTWIDPSRGERIIEAMRQFRMEYDERLKDWKKNPLHDWSSHGAAAVRYFAVGFDDSSILQSRGRKRDTDRPSGATHWSA